MKIEAGKFYKTRDGRKVGPMSKPYNIPEGEVVGCEDFKGRDLWWSDGRCSRSSEKALDLISEWPTADEHGPIREVRRREIVPGQWGNINVNCVVDGNVFINVRDDFGHVAFNAEQLREAAHLFVQLAEVLEDNQ
jgi:hypothetical protein